MLSYPQKGHALRLTFNIYFNAKQWFIGNYSQDIPSGNVTGGWTWYSPNGGQQNNVGAYVARDQHLDFGADRKTLSTLAGDGQTARKIETYLDGYFVRESDGAKHYYGDLQQQSCTTGPGPCPTLYTDTPYYNIYPANDSSGFYPLNGGLLQATQITDANGVTYNAPHVPGQNETVTDKSGNSITVAADGWHDSVGRFLPGTFSGPGDSDNADYSISPGGNDPIPGVPTSVPTSCPAGTTQARVWNVPSVNGGTQPYFLCYSQLAYQTTFNLDGLLSTTNYQGVGEMSSTGSGSSPVTVLTAVVLPDDASSAYTFQYDQSLSLTKITLPTGGSITYTWVPIPFLLPGNVTTPASLAVATRTVDPGHGQPLQKWYYHWVTNVTNNNGYPTVSIPWSIVTDPYGNDVEHQLGGGALIENATMAYSGCGPHDTFGACNASSPGVLMKTESYVLTPTGNMGADTGTPSADAIVSLVKPTTITTTLSVLGGTLVTKRVETLTSGYESCSTWNLGGWNGFPPPHNTNLQNCHSTNQTKDLTEYDFGSSTVLRKTSFQYQWQDPSNGPSYIAAHLFSLVSDVTIADGGTTTYSKSHYGYDPIGNQTSVQGFIDAGHSVSTGTVYNSSGMPTQTTDANQNVTLIGYDSTGAIPNLITHPTVNGVVNKEPFSYDSNLGLVTSHTDANGHPTTYTHDSMGRSLTITLPLTDDEGITNGTLLSKSGTTNFTYTDSSSGWSTQKQLLAGFDGTTIISNVNYDGTGQPINTLLSSVNPGINTTTTYDKMGRILSTSNPYLTGDVQIGVTQFAYDALGRKTRQTQPDGTFLQWCYNGIATDGQTNCAGDQSASGTRRWVDVSDESGHDRQLLSDALGRLTFVVEPTGLKTAYTYDPLNLRKVDQYGGSITGSGDRIRTFTYDWISRLLTSCNPESISAGSTCSSSGAPYSDIYTYDANSNVTSKTDARGVTINYSPAGSPIDALNRVIKKTYSDGTPSVSYVYDKLNLPFGGDPSQAFPATNGIGRQTESYITSASGAKLVDRVTDSYYPPGQPAYSIDCLGDCSLSTSGITPNVNYVYDLAGNVLATSTLATPTANGVSSRSLPYYLSIYNYDAANRLLKVTGHVKTIKNGSTTADDGPYTLYLATAYRAAGVSNASLAINPSTGIPAMTMTRTYDDLRMRVLSETDLNSQQMPIYKYSIGPYAGNGDVSAFTDSVMGTWALNYDSLDRLMNGVVSGAGAYSGLILNWTYDAFGNRTSQVPTGTVGLPMPSAQYLAFGTPNNRVAGWQYDNAGNVLYDNLNHYLYDGEGRLCAVQGYAGAMTQYVYDADGFRFAKGTISSFNCNSTTNGFAVTSIYSTAINGDQMAEFDATDYARHANVFANGRLLATFVGSNRYFAFNDWLGTKRAQITSDGNIANLLTFGSLPYGDGLTSIGGNATEQHFTGKERDNESQNEYFQARYYSSGKGRFLSPDDPENDSHLGDPQSLNLYSYGRNNPLKNIDPDGETCQTNWTGGDIYDDGDGQGCSQLDTTTVSATVTAQPGNVATSLALNGLMALSNMAGDYFAGLTGLRAYSNDQLSKDWTGTASNIGINVAGLMVGPEGEAGEAITITSTRLEHILEAHAPGGIRSAGKSVFDAGADIPSLIKRAESTVPDTLPNGDLRFTVDAGHTIGIDRSTGQATSKYTVVTDSSRSVQTAHPGTYK